MLLSNCSIFSDFQIMKAVEVLSIFAAIFLFNLSLGNGAPQWRPQGRFGKRYGVRTNDLMTALTSGRHRHVTHVHKKQYEKTPMYYTEILKL